MLPTNCTNAATPGDTPSRGVHCLHLAGGGDVGVSGLGAGALLDHLDAALLLHLHPALRRVGVRILARLLRTNTLTSDREVVSVASFSLNHPNAALPLHLHPALRQIRFGVFAHLLQDGMTEQI